jgi:hypothetical protein
MRRWLWVPSLVAGALGAPSTGVGQSTVRASADAGAALIHQRGDTVAVVAPTVGGEIDLRGRRTAGRATLTSTLAQSGRWSAQGDLLLSHFAGAYGSPWEMGGMASVLRYTGETATTQLTAYGRRHLDRLAWGAWAGGSAGLTVRKYWRAPIAAVEGGAWSRVGPLQLSLGLATQRAHLDSSNAYEFPPTTLPPGVIPVTSSNGAPAPSVAVRRGFDIRTLVATDVTALAAWRGPRVELSATAIARHAPAQAGRLLGSVLGSAAWWAQPSLALTASAGSLAADPIRSAPASSFVTFGARWRPSPSGSTSVTRAPQAGTPEPVHFPADAAGRAVAHVVAREGGATRVLRVQAPGAAQVEVRGDATEWRPVALTASGRYWELVLPAGVEPGTQRLLVRVDGGAWVAPANLPTVEDDFGARVGLLVVP